MLYSPVVTSNYLIVIQLYHGIHNRSQSSTVQSCVRCSTAGILVYFIRVLQSTPFFSFFRYLRYTLLAPHQLTPRAFSASWRCSRLQWLSRLCSQIGRGSQTVDWEPDGRTAAVRSSRYQSLIHLLAATSPCPTCPTHRP